MGSHMGDEERQRDRGWVAASSKIPFFNFLLSVRGGSLSKWHKVRQQWSSQKMGLMNFGGPWREKQRRKTNIFQPICHTFQSVEVRHSSFWIAYYYMMHNRASVQLKRPSPPPFFSSSSCSWKKLICPDIREIVLLWQSLLRDCCYDCCCFFLFFFKQSWMKWKWIISAASEWLSWIIL